MIVIELSDEDEGYYIIINLSYNWKYTIINQINCHYDRAYAYDTKAILLALLEFVVSLSVLARRPPTIWSPRPTLWLSFALLCGVRVHGATSSSNPHRMGICTRKRTGFTLLLNAAIGQSKPILLVE